MTDPVTVILGGLTVALISGTVGKYLGSNGKIKDNQCGERRAACSGLILEKIDHLVITVNELKTDISNIKIV